MYRNRIIPVLLMEKKMSLVKTVRFKNPIYIGDPINAVKIFNEKEVDELILLDINASKEKKSPDLNYLKDIAGECFMPLCYGGGIASLTDIYNLINVGIEKISINTKAIELPDFVIDASKEFGTSTIVISIDVKKDIFGQYKVYSHSKKTNSKYSLHEFVKLMENNGAGEILLNSVDKDGTMNNYDFNLIKIVSESVSIPIIACGGAGNLTDLSSAINSGATAAAAGSLFVFYGKHKAVLINYPSNINI